ncbi:hypothetical protein CPB84DRAFT_1825263 [Gymnopilus junonius]|uniref:NmrA-like domain-containing protein n=1 Tax=Gymnopilus junonius TaxID=109634 RepID=A0A9P5NM33_GYMJU|nr:hypothetical protein CPB84DRAFT_1825263 [Gymnopilus junonius]
MTTLIIGGSGKTGQSLAKLLKAANRPALLTSRSGNMPEAFKAVAFDWVDPTTFENPFKVDPSIDRVYLIAPRVANMFEVVKPFIDLAISKGTKRFVFLSASQVQPGDPNLGQIHQYLIDMRVDYTVLRPTWFIQNFATNLAYGIKEKSEIFSATGEGKIPLVAVEDIAQAAFEVLTAEKSPNRDYFLVGPELWSYDEVAKLMSSVLGREIKHMKVEEEERKQVFIRNGIPSDLASRLAQMEVRVAHGSEAKYFDESADRKIVGKHTLREFVEANRAVWMK